MMEIKKEKMIRKSSFCGGVHMEYKISYIGDSNVNNVHHIGVDYNGKYYSVIFGRYVNGGFFSIPNMGVGGELSKFGDIFWNEESLCRTLKSKRVAKVIAQAIAEYRKELNNEG